MTAITRKIKSLFAKNPATLPTSAFQLDFVKSKKTMLKELLLSKESGNAIGVYCKGMGEGMFLTVVEEIHSNDLIVFNRYDMSGVILSRYEFTLDEIQTVWPINQRYRHPLLSNHSTPRFRNVAVA